MSEKIAVHCKTEEEWDAVNAKAHNSAPIMSWSTAKGYKDICIYTNRPDSVDKEEHCINNGYTIISASEYLKEGEEEFKVGERVGYNGIECTITYLLETFCTITYDDGSREGAVYNSRLRKLTNKQNKKENKDMTINSSIRKVFVEEDKAGYDLVEKMQKNFGDQIDENFTGEMLLRNNKDKYISEIKRLDEAAEKAAKEAAKA